MKEKLKKMLEAHRKKEFICCGEGCFCWEVEQLLAQQEQAAVLPCGHDSNNLRLGANGYGCAECEATRR